MNADDEDFGNVSAIWCEKCRSVYVCIVDVFDLQHSGIEERLYGR